MASCAVAAVRRLIRTVAVEPHTCCVLSRQDAVCGAACANALQALTNVFRMCQNYVDPACLLERDADMCVFQDIQRLLAEANHAQAGALSAGAVAGIVVAGEGTCNMPMQGRC